MASIRVHTIKEWLIDATSMEARIQLGQKYCSGPIASTDLHAGGIFFCIIYHQVLKFLPQGVVTLTNEILDELRPMDDYDVKQIVNSKQVGRFSINDRGYIYCEFEEFTLTGSFSTLHPTMLAFHRYNKNTGYQVGLVVTLQAGKG